MGIGMGMGMGTETGMGTGTEAGTGSEHKQVHQWFSLKLSSYMFCLSFVLFCVVSNL